MASVAVLFSGGRDSTLAAKRLVEEGHRVTLLSFEGGFGYGGEARELRFRECDLIFGPSNYTRRILRVQGLVRRVCLVDLVTDVQRDGHQLLLLGEFLSMVVAAIRYVRLEGLQALASGVTAYQSYFPEQGAAATRFIEDLCDREGITYLRPVGGYVSQEMVKEELLLAGFSSKSLEGCTLLADICDEVPEEVVTSYLDAKRELIYTLLAS